MMTKIPGFEGAFMIGSLEEDTKEFGSQNLRQNTEIDIDLSVDEPPIMLCSNQIADLYANSKYDEIKSHQNKIENDLTAIGENIRTHGEAAFVKVGHLGKQYYLASSKLASLWIYPREVKEIESFDENGDSRISYQNWYQVGIHSTNGRVTGTVDYVFTCESQLTSIIFFGLVAKMVQIILQQGTRLVLNSLVNEMIAYVAQKGFKANIKIAPTSVSKFIRGAAFLLNFFGLRVFWNWPNKQYSIKLSIYNWSSTDKLYISDFYGDNAKLLCDEQDKNNALETDIPNMIAPGNQILPPGFNPVEPIEKICYYVTYYFENNYTFFQGCGIALKVEIGQKESGKGLWYAFDCPRFSDNCQKASDNLKAYQKSKDYYETGAWNPNPLRFSIQTENIPVCVTLDALNGNGAEFNPIINFNHQQ